MSDFKRLGFVQGYAGSALAVSENVYKTVRGYTPNFAEVYVRQVEDKTASLAAPYLTWAQDAGEKALRTADIQVDGVANGLSSVLVFSRDLHNNNMTTFNNAKEQYYTVVEKAFTSTKSKLDPTPVLGAVLETARAYVDKAIALTDPDFVVDATKDALSKLTNYPVVSKAVDLSKPAVGFAATKYASLHDALVATPAYKKAYSTLEGGIGSVTDSAVFKRLVVETAYPLLAPVADPVIANITKSRYVAQLAAHVKPVA